MSWFTYNRHKPVDEDLSKRVAIVGLTPTLGDLVRDNITGFVGIVEAMVSNLYNTDACYVQPVTLDSNGNIKASQSIEINQLSVIEEHKMPQTEIIKASEIGDVHFLDTVADKITGMEGTVVGVAVWLNGCIRFDIYPKVDDSNVGLLNTFFLHPLRINIVEKSPERKPIEIKWEVDTDLDKDQMEGWDCAIIRDTERDSVTSGGPVNTTQLQSQSKIV